MLISLALLFIWPQLTVEICIYSGPQRESRKFLLLHPWQRVVLYYSGRVRINHREEREIKTVINLSSLHRILPQNCPIQFPAPFHRLLFTQPPPPPSGSVGQWRAVHSLTAKRINHRPSPISSPGNVHLERALFDLRHVQLERRYRLRAGSGQYGTGSCQQLFAFCGRQLEQLLHHVHVLCVGKRGRKSEDSKSICEITKVHSALTACVLRLLLAEDNNASRICRVNSLNWAISPRELGTSSRYWNICGLSKGETGID